MDRLVHYTSDANWRRIQKSGYLLPRTHPNATPAVLSDRVRSMIQDKSYVVGIPRPLDDGWVSSGLMDYLREHTTGEVALNVPILDSKRGFVRDHIHGSPKIFIARYGEDLFRKLHYKEIAYDDPRLVEAAIAYLESTVPLDSYDGGYSAPEIWLPQATPIGRLTKI